MQELHRARQLRPGGHVRRLSYQFRRQRARRGSRQPAWRGFSPLAAISFRARRANTPYLDANGAQSDRLTLTPMAGGESELSVCRQHVADSGMEMMRALRRNTKGQHEQ